MDKCGRNISWERTLPIFVVRNIWLRSLIFFLLFELDLSRYTIVMSILKASLPRVRRFVLINKYWNQVLKKWFLKLHKLKRKKFDALIVYGKHMCKSFAVLRKFSLIDYCHLSWIAQSSPFTSSSQEFLWLFLWTDFRFVRDYLYSHASPILSRIPPHFLQISITLC